VRRLDYLLVTHGDLDHLGGALAVLRDFHPREVWAGVPVARSAPLQMLQRAARDARVPWRWLQHGDRLELGGAALLVHHPPPPDWERQYVRNDDSVVLEARLGEVSVLLSGDISRAVEPEVLARLAPARLRVVTAPHHGSLTSSGEAWVAALEPAVVLVSAGRGNLFGHPAPAVIERYRTVRAEIFRTDQDGQIDVVTDGRSVDVHTFTGRRWRFQ
jgi:competence protein ComEC